MLLEIENLYDLIEEKENYHLELINNGSDENILRRSEATIEELKQRLQALKDIFLDDSLSNGL